MHSVGVVGPGITSGTLSAFGQSVVIDVKRAVGIRVLATSVIGVGGTYTVQFSQDNTNWEAEGIATSYSIIDGTSTFHPCRGYVFGRVVMISPPINGGIDGSAVFHLSTPVEIATEIVGSGLVTPISGSVSDSGNNTLITPLPGYKLRITYLSYNPASPVECAFRFGDEGLLFLRNNIVTGGSIVAKDYDVRYIQGQIDEPLILNLSSSATTIWNANYIEVQ